MKILFDECVDHRLRLEIQDYDIKTVPEMGWAGVKNGQLLTLAAQQFDVLITVDRRMVDQVDNEKVRLPVIVIHGKSIQLKHLKPLVPKLKNKLVEPLTPGFHDIGI